MGRSGWWAARALTFVTVFVAAGYAGRATVVGPGSLSLVWPAAGVAALWLCTSTRTSRPWDLALMATCTFTVNFSTGASPLMSSWFVITNLAQSIWFFFLMRRLVPDSWNFGGLRVLGRFADLFALVASCVSASLVAATLGEVGLVIDGNVAGWLSFWVWWGRNTAGMLLIVSAGLLLLAPLASMTSVSAILTGLRKELLPHDRRGVVHVVLLVSLTSGILFEVFVHRSHEPLSFLLLFSTVVAGVWLRPPGVTLHCLVTGGVAVVLTLQGAGPFAGIVSVYERALVAQLFVMMTLVTGLLLAFSRAERDIALAELSESEARAADRASLLAAVLETMREGITVISEPGGVVLRNPAGRALIGLDPSSAEVGPLLRATEIDLRHQDGSKVVDAELPWRLALDGEELVAHDYRLRGHNGGPEKIVETTTTHLPGQHPGDPVRAVVNFRDVTADRQDRDALLSFAGVVAHDLFNPLTVIHGWAHSLDDAFDEGPVAPLDGKAMVARITGASLHMRGFIDDLLSYTVARDAELSTERLDLSAIAEEMAGMQRDGATRPRIRVQPGLRATGDPVLVRQLLGNLIGNAVKYVGAEVRPDIEVRATSAEGWVHVTVTDNGIGVPLDKRERIFDNFQRAHTEGYAGTGIGLAICRRVVERHGGVIAVEDARDRSGSVFTFTLPA